MSAASQLSLAPRLDAAPELCEHVPVAVISLDRDRRCQTANAAARALFAPLDPIESHWTALFSHWSSPPVLASGTGPDGVPARHSDGRTFSCRTSALAGEGLCVALVDVSDQMNLGMLEVRDSLTGLLQRASFRARLQSALAACERTGDTLALHYLDLDRFKTINDTLGHPVGDALLSKVADRLRSLATGDDVVARFGGDEFVFLQTGAVDAEAAQTLATRIVDLIGRTYVAQGHMLNIGVSVGVALAPQDGAEPDALVRHADLALFKAKADGRSTFRFFEPAMNARMQARRLLETDLRRALALRQFTLALQPLVNLQTNNITGFEALLRWTHPERGPVSPADFIPLAEEIGLIVPIGEWVLRTACKTASSWPTPATIAVNISPVQFKTGKLAQTVASALAHSGLRADRLELEITEGALLDETNLVLSALHEIRSLGVRISMDDFGTGYSSLSYLRKFPFDKIKIDQSFVRGLGNNADCDAIVRAVANLGATLGMRTTAEGVETIDQLSRVHLEGCTEVQGYFTGRPMTVDAVADLLLAQTGDRPS